MSNLTKILNLTTTTLDELPFETESNMSNGESHDRNTIVPDFLVKDTEFVISVVLVPVLCISGIVGNSLAMDVFLGMARRLKHSIYIFMFSLVMVDSLSLLVFVFRSIPVIFVTVDEERGHYWNMHLQIPFLCFTKFFKTMNAAILILMSVERLVAIRNPLSFREMAITKYPITFIGVACAIIALGILPLPFVFELKASIGLNGTEVFQVLPRENVKTMHFIYILLQTTFGTYLPYLALVFINIGIYVQYRHEVNSKKQIYSNNHSHATQLRLMATISLIILIYTVLILPEIIVQTLVFIDKKYSSRGQESNVIWFLIHIANVFQIVNCSVDFLIYIYMSSTYRERFKERFCSNRRRSGNNPG